METSIDIIELRLPLKAEYVSIARLTVSGIASRIGFDIEAIEDIKVAVSEVCSKYIQKRNTQNSDYSDYRIIFKPTHEYLEIAVDSEDGSFGCLFDQDDDEFAISILNALMDEVKLCVKDGERLLTMTKYLEGKML